MTDHCLTYLPVTLFIKLDLDVLIAERTAPSHSRDNPIERVMSILNIGLQSVGVTRTEIGDNLATITY